MARKSLRAVSQLVDESLTMYVIKSMTFPTPHIGHSRHGLFFLQDWIVSTMLNLLKRTLDLWSNEKNKHVEGLFHQYFEGLVKDIQIVVSVVSDNRRINV
jgi:hypothetical protein